MRIDEIKARLEAATPGRWKREEVHIENDFGDLCSFSFVFAGNEPLTNYNTGSADVDFIASAPADIAYLLDEIDRLTSASKEAVELLQTVTTKYETSVKLYGKATRLLNAMTADRNAQRARADAAEKELNDIYKNTPHQG